MMYRDQLCARRVLGDENGMTGTVGEAGLSGDGIAKNTVGGEFLLAAVHSPETAL
jgi:hypothetical protein